MANIGKCAGSQRNISKCPADPIKEFATKLQRFLDEQERRASHNRVILAITGSAMGLLGVLFSDRIAAAAIQMQEPDGLNQEKLDYFIPWAGCFVTLLCMVPWLIRSQLAAPLVVWWRVKYDHAVVCFKKGVKCLQALCELVEKAALRAASNLLLVIGVR